MLEPNTLNLLWRWLMLLSHGWCKYEPKIWYVVQNVDTVPGYDRNTYINIPYLISGLTNVA